MADEQSEEKAPATLVPLPDDPNVVPGKYAAIDISPNPIFGPDQLGSYKSAIADMTESVTKADSASRIFEILQAWEARLFSRGYHFLLAGNKGWGLFGGAGRATPNSIMAEGNARKLFPVNVYGARQDKITAALSREVPGLKFSPKDPDSPPDQAAADEADNYLKVWVMDSDIKGVVARICRFFYTDGRVVLWTRSVADQQRWGTETPDEQSTFGAPEDAGVTPETENQGDGSEEGAAASAEFQQQDGSTVIPPKPAAPETPSSEGPAICEVTTAYGVLESKVPIGADDIHDMGSVRIATEVDVDILKERYPWIEDKIEPGQSTAGSSDQYDRMARVNVRLAVQNSSASGESSLNEATETHDWHRPSKYRRIKDKAIRKLFYDNFPDGLRVTHAGSQLAFVRNESMDDHIEIRHSKDGDGQNRRAIGTNYLPLQKILNQNMSLLVRYFVACIPRRFAVEGPLNVAAMNRQGSDPSIVTPVVLDAGGAQSIQGLTGIEAVPQPTTGLMEFVQWLVDGGPEAMDGATPTMFGGGDAGTVGEATLNRDQSLQVYSGPWAQICTGLAKCATQAVKCAAQNRKANIRSRTPGQGKLTVELANLQGDALCSAESLEIPQTLAEQEAQTAQLVEQSPNVDLYKAIVSNPLNLPFFAQMPSLGGLNIPGLDAVEKQQGEFELLFDAGPIDNPLIAELQEKIQQLTTAIAAGQTHPEAQTPEGQQMMQQLQAQLPTLQQQLQVAQQTPLVSTVQVAQDGSENHAIEAAVVLAEMNSARGRKFKNGDQQQQAVFQNLKLHWQEHAAMAAKLQPVPPIIPKVSITGAIDKAPPNVQAQAWAAVGVAAKPEDFTETDELVPHEVTVEKEGVDANGVPVKQKISTVNPGGKLN